MTFGVIISMVVVLYILDDQRWRMIALDLSYVFFDMEHGIVPWPSKLHQNSQPTIIHVLPKHFMVDNTSHDKKAE